MIFAKEAGQSHLAGAEVPAAGRGGGGTQPASLPSFSVSLVMLHVSGTPRAPGFEGEEESTLEDGVA